ncbi:MAG: hypothetical protein IT324_07440 [Anaerolineae bacterium]|nr:hypothetical protein [Anaerolineae bacterium]
MTIWHDMVATALLGTERQAPNLPPPGDPLGDLLAQIVTNDKEHALLSAAAVIAFHQRAGRLPASDTQPLIAPCEADDQPLCRSPSAQHLAMMLDGAHRDVLPEWLATLAAVGRRVPEEYIPALLDAGKRDTDLRPLILPVIGRRGSWLAAQNPDWRYAITVDSEGDWQTGSRAARVLMLQRLRASDPNAARDLLISTWDEESADECAAFLETFVTGLNMNDEPFLESLLDDRRKRVRAIAADLLARLPESRLSRRMIARVKPLLTFITVRKKARIDVTLPDTCDSTMIRDGIDPKMHKGMGEKAWWLYQMMSVVPPSFWSAEWHTSSAQIVDAARRGGWTKVLWEAFTQAAQRHHDSEWAEAIWLVLQERGGDSEVEIDPQQLLHVLSPERREILCFKTLNDNAVLDRDVLLLLDGCKHQWGHELSRAVLQRLPRYIALHSNIGLLEQFARYLSPSVIDDARTLLENVETEHYWKSYVERFLATLYFRYEMLKELNQ